MGGVEELFDPGVEQQQEIQARDSDGLDPEDDRDQGDRHRLHEAGGDHDPLPIVPVDEDTGEQPDDQARDRGHHQRHTDGERGPGHPEDIDAGRKVGQRRTGGRDELRRPEQREVALPEDGEHRRGGGYGRCRHRTSNGASRAEPSR